jgi:rubrerythrin
MKHEIKDGISRILDQVLDGKETNVEKMSRRVWTKNFAAVSATSAVLWACGGKDDDKAVAANEYTLEMKIKDATTINIAIDLEHEAIALYTAAADITGVWAESASLLAPTFLDVAKEFLAHHTVHLGALKTQIEKLEPETGIAAAASKGDEYLAAYPDIAALTGASGLLTVLQVAAEREMNAANAYYGVIAAFNNRDLMQTLGGLSADEAAHYGVLNAAAFAHAFLSEQTTSELTAKNLVSGALPLFTYPRKVRS